MKKILCLALAAIMLLGLVACGGTDKPNTDKPNQGGSTGKEAPTLIRWIAADVGHVGRDEVEEEIVRYVKEKINVELDIIWYPAENSSTLGTIVVADEWDVATLGSDLFDSNVGRHAFLPLDDYIDAYMPTVKEVLPAENLEACKWKGEIYGVTPYKDFAESWGLLYNKDLMEEYGLEFPTEYKTERDLVDFYYEATKTYRDANPNSTRSVIRHGSWLNSWFQYDRMYGSWSAPLVVTNIPNAEGFDNIDPNTAFSPYFTDDYAEYVKTLWQLAKDDIIPSAAGDGDMDWSGGQGFCQPSSGWIEVSENQFSPTWDCGWYGAENAILTTASIKSQISVISSNSENPEAAAKFIEMTFGDEYLCTTLKFGIQGKDWEDANNDGVIELLDRNFDAGNRYWYMWYGTINSSIINTKFSEGSSPDFLDKVKELNASGIPSAHLGFVFDPTNVANEIAACNNVLSQYNSMLKYPGFKNPDAFLEEFRTNLKKNGIDKIVAEVQTQLDAWHAAQ